MSICSASWLKSQCLTSTTKGYCVARVSSKARREAASARQKIHDLTEAALMCKAFGHQWDEDPAADWHTPRWDYIHAIRLYLRCSRGCGTVKVAVYTMDGRWVTGFSRPPEANRIIGLGRGAGRKPFIQEMIERRNKTASGKNRSRGTDKAKTKRATG